jgi:16S rRNA (guanine(966)-N(2))-methyltransferase RsmD
MRITGGNLKGRNISAPADLPVRPTTDFAKVALFNILNNQIEWEETSAFDLFSGTGSISFEMASRDCGSVISVEQNFKANAFIKKTIEKLSLENTIKAINMDVFSFLKQSNFSCNLVFADPPFDSDFYQKLPSEIISCSMVQENAIVIIEHHIEINFTSFPQFIEKRTYGKVNFSFFKK